MVGVIILVTLLEQRREEVVWCLIRLQSTFSLLTPTHHFSVLPHWYPLGKVTTVFQAIRSPSFRGSKQEECVQEVDTHSMPHTCSL